MSASYFRTSAARPVKAPSPVVLPRGIRGALAAMARGADLDPLAADLIRRSRELLLFRVRLNPHDRRCGKIVRLIHAVRLRTAG